MYVWGVHVYEVCVFVCVFSCDFTCACMLTVDFWHYVHYDIAYLQVSGQNATQQIEIQALIHAYTHNYKLTICQHR